MPLHVNSFSFRLSLALVAEAQPGLLFVASDPQSQQWFPSKLSKLRAFWAACLWHYFSSWLWAWSTGARGSASLGALAPPVCVDVGVILATETERFQNSTGWF